MATSLEELLDKQALHELLMRYCRGVDRNDAELLASVYHSDAYDDHGIYRGDAHGFVEWVLGRQEGTRSSMHCILNEYFTLDGDVAHGECYFVWCATSPEDAAAPPELTMTGGRYIDRFERRDGEWRIARRQVVLEWGRVFLQTEAPLDAFVSARRDRSDPSYLELDDARP